MKNKIEQKLDAALKELKIKARVYHFRDDVEPFTAVTVVEDRLTWQGIRRELDRFFHSPKRRQLSSFCPATQLLNTLRRKDLYGVAICDKRDRFSRPQGRFIAKGRLLKHLGCAFKYTRKEGFVVELPIKRRRNYDI